MKITATLLRKLLKGASNMKYGFAAGALAYMVGLFYFIFLLLSSFFLSFHLSFLSV